MPITTSQEALRAAEAWICNEMPQAGGGLRAWVEAGVSRAALAAIGRVEVRHG